MPSDAVQARRHAGGLVALLALGALAVAACSGGDDDPASAAGEATTTTVAGEPVAPLTGQSEPDEARRSRPAVAVKVDASVPALGQQSGLGAADLVYVEKVEGGVTRLFAVFQSTDAEVVGPVRSARSTDVNLAANLGRPLLAYSGGNNGVLGLIRQGDVVDLGYDVKPEIYQPLGRGLLRFYVSTTTLHGLAPPDAGPPQALFAYRGQGEDLGAGAEASRGVGIAYGDRVNTQVVYEPVPDGWARSQDGMPHVEQGGARITPTNVIVQFTEYRDAGFVDTTGTRSPEAVVVGEGEAWILTGDQLVRGRWSRPDLGAPTTYVDSTGAPVALTAGRTWVELAPVGSAVTLP